MKKEKFKGYELVDHYPEDGWLKGYFYAQEDDIKNSKRETTKAYQDISFLKHRDYILHLLNVKKSEKILDVGCGLGTLMVYSGLLGAEVYGIDISKEEIKKANEYLQRYAIKGKAIIGDARELCFSNGYFDKAISGDFLEHMRIEDNVKVLREIKRVLRADGILVIKTPNLTYLRFARYYKMIKRIIQFKNPFDVIIAHTKEDDHQHIGLLTKIKLLGIIKSAGFLNFKFYYDINPKLEKISFSLADLCKRIPFIRDIFNEDLIVVIYKPIVLSFDNNSLCAK